jgi:pantothenate kinase
MLVAFDFGLTNTDVVISKSDENQFYSFPTIKINNAFITYIFDTINIEVSQVSHIAVTGGKSSDLTDTFNDIPIKKVNEVQALEQPVSILMEKNLITLAGYLWAEELIKAY